MPDHLIPTSAVTDPARLAILDGLAVLDTPAEQGFDDAVRLATRLCATPVALVSLVAADRQWFKARIGFPPCETDLDRSVCKFALVEPDLLVISDLAADPRTAANPLVTGAPGIRFYAGAPLRLADGLVVGSLCVIDTVPRPEGLTPEQADDLRALGRQVSGLLDLRRVVVSRDEALGRQDVELRQARRIELLSKASAALVGSADPGAVLEPILATGIEALGFDQCYIYDVEPGGRRLRLVRSIGADEAACEALASVDLDVPLCGIVVQSQQPLVLEAVQASTEPRYEIARRGGVNAFAGYPVTSRGRVVSVVSFASTQEPAFDPEALDFFTALARLMSGLRERRDADAALRASETRFRLAQEAGNVGTFEVDVASGLISVSAEFARLYGVPQTGLYSAERFEALVVPEDRALPSNDDTRQAGTAALDVEYRIHRADDGALRWIARRATFVRDAAGSVVQMFGTVQDVTDAKQATLRQTALIEIGDRLRDLDTVPAIVHVAAEVAAGVLGASRAGYGLVDPTRESIDVPTDWCALGVTSIAGHHDLRDYGSYVEDLKRGQIVVLDDVEVDPRSQKASDALLAVGVRTMINVPVMERGRLVGLGFVHYPQSHVLSAEERDFVRTVADRVQIAVARVQAEEQRTLLNGELSHRLKNTLAMVQGIAGQTLRGIPDQAPVQAFMQRVLALSSAHDILVQGSWATAPMRAVIDGVMRLHAPPSRLTVDGPDLMMTSQAALSLSLLLHELATNAVKHGALSTERGHVSIAWSIEDGTEPVLTLAWQERGGPPATVPTRRGFGSRLIESGLMGTRDADLRYGQLGISAEFRAPLSQVQAS